MEGTEEGVERRKGRTVVGTVAWEVKGVEVVTSTETKVPSRKRKSNMAGRLGEKKDPLIMASTLASEDSPS